MKINKKDFFVKATIIGVLLLGSFLRLVGTYPGYPPYHSDEGISYSSAVSMIKNGNLDPLRYDYPSVTPLSNYIFFKSVFIPASWIKFYIQNVGKIIDGYIKLPLSKVDYDRIFQLEILGAREVNALTWGRIVTAIFGIGTIVLVYYIATALFGKKAGIVSLLLVAVNYRLVLNSHFGLPDTYNGFFLMLSFLWNLILYKNPNRKNYLLAGFFAALSLSTKYQPFALIPLFVIHLTLSLKEKGLKKRIKYLFRTEAFLIPLIVAFVFIFLNPYAFINLEQTKVWLEGVSSKYQPSRYIIDVYALSYLFHTGIGQVISLLSLLGIILSFKRNFFGAILLLSLVVPFFYVTVYYSGGGFYTRNFITIIPFVLVFAGVSITSLLSFIKSEKITLLFGILLAFLVSKDQLWMSSTVATTYTKPWNYLTLSDWETENIPEGAKISAHSSVPITVKNAERLSYDFNKDFSISEFRNSGAEYAIANLDWETNAFYFWMNQYFTKGIEYFNKPSSLLDDMYPAMALRELSDYSIYSVINPWPAPDSDFIVAKVPKVKISNEEKLLIPQLYKKGGDDSNLSLENNDSVYSIKKSTLEPVILRWESSPFALEKVDGIEFTSQVKTEIANLPEGFLFIKFYKSKEDAEKNINRIAVRLSSRNRADGRWNSLSVAVSVPQNATYATVGLQTYDSAQTTVSLKEPLVNKASVAEGFDGVKINKIYLEDNIIFPISHGYL